MKLFRIALVVACCVVLAAVIRGDDWRVIGVSVVFGLLVAAMLETMPLLDWLYPKDTNHNTDD